MLTDVYQHAQQLATPLATAVVEGLQLQISGINLGPQPMQAVYPPAGGVPWAVPHYEGGYDAAPGYGAADGGNYGAEWYPDGGVYPGMEYGPGSSRRVHGHTLLYGETGRWSCPLNITAAQGQGRAPVGCGGRTSSPLSVRALNAAGRCLPIMETHPGLTYRPPGAADPVPVVVQVQTQTAVFKLFQGDHGQHSFSSLWWWLDASGGADRMLGPYSCEQMILAYIAQPHGDRVACAIMVKSCLGVV
eukprot:XP_001699893.1 predicted protein [Chlamydomonas reinhardtii]